MDLLRELFDQQKSSLDHFFKCIELSQVERAFNALLACRGTIVLTGVGKSGLVAQKIVATLVSTGSRAAFLCPLNAMHGDIGSLSSHDLLVFFSKSGATQELLGLVPFAKKKEIKTLSIVSQMGSELEKQSTICVHLPLLRELCPFDLAPTASTAIQLIFGDILAMALMRKKQFSVQDFAANHPGGALGKMISYRVADLMLTNEQIPFCSPTDPLLDMLHELSMKRCGCLVITDDQKNLLGIFTDGDLRRCLRAQGTAVLEKKLSELMTKTPRTTGPDHLAVEAVRIMEENPLAPVTVLPVLEGRRVVGLIRMHDILQTNFH